MKQSMIRKLLELDLHPASKRLYGELIEEFEREFIRWRQPDQRGWDKAGSQEQTLARQLGFFLQNQIEKMAQHCAVLDLKFTEFRQRSGHAASEHEKREHILDFAAELGSSRRQLSGDKRAFKRWFDYAAVVERYVRRSAEYERCISFSLGRLGVLCALVLHEVADGNDILRWWQRLDLENLIKPLLTFKGDSSVSIASFQCLSSALRALPTATRETCISDSTLQFIYRSVLERRRNTWLQCEALSLLQNLSTDSFEKALRNRLERPEKGDDLFVRRRAVRLLGVQIRQNPELCDLVDTVLHDPSPAVRQALAEILPCLPHTIFCTVGHKLAIEDGEAAVRGAALLALCDLLANSTDFFEFILTTLHKVLTQEKDSFVLKIALRIVAGGYAQLHDQPSGARQWFQTMFSALAKLHTTADSLEVRRCAAQIREKLWMQNTSEAMALYEKLEQIARVISPGETERFPRNVWRKYDRRLLGRTLSCLARDNYGFDLQAWSLWPRITRGHRFGFRVWRFIHEARNPSSDKRQAYPHTIGRIFSGELRAPSGILSELAQTKVPGEPCFMAEEGGWRPYLPLVDDMISALRVFRKARAVEIYSSEGVTIIRPPRFFLSKLRAWWLLNFKFVHFAQLRNWREGNAELPNAYVKALRMLGFEIEYRHHREPTETWSSDPAVARFFTVGLPFSGGDLYQRIQDYFFSVYENTLQELMLFLTVMTTWFLGRHLWMSHQIRKLRRAIPLVVGGWGTRGKSGTERLKAALFNALGHGVVSKTTGCEAMFVQAHPYGTLREMFLFRPYDKATIWEQVNVLRIARQLGAHVMLWECMGLTPAYVYILQQQWMRDDISTITNTYPDHEDLQGPAGINIPQVMTNFIPRDATLITTEEQMLPILATAAQARNTKFRTASWLQAGLLTSDVLARFPYAEHPYNIALVLEMAEELGVDRDFALKEMADRVVADLGVLKALPVAFVRGRRLEFINGMSANERFGCLGNWERMGFARQDPYINPEIWLSTVVNNRADRVSRSRVFASILVEDISADRHYLIGTNLEGLLSYIREAWAGYVKEQTLWPSTREATPIEVLESSARRLRIPYSENHLLARTYAMLQGVGVEVDAQHLVGIWSEPERLRQIIGAVNSKTSVDEIISHIQQLATDFVEYQALAEQLDGTGSSVNESLDTLYRRQLWTWFERKLVTIRDPHASGDQIINRIVESTPPGLQNRIMGLQNIKGTGLDFVYRWQAWEACFMACQELLSGDLESAKQGLFSHETRISFNNRRLGDPELAERGLRALAAFQEYSLLCEEYVHATVERIKNCTFAQNELFQAELTGILNNMDKAMKKVQAQLNLAEDKSGGLWSRLLSHIEAFLDAGDAVKRRKFANRIYRDLVNERISQERAVLELQKLNKRQKGGWLQRRVEIVLHRSSS